MFLQTSIIHLFILLFYLPISSNAYFPKYKAFECKYGNGTYTKDSIYHDNLKLLLSSLSMSTPITGYFNDTQGSSNSTNQVFGHAICRGDLQLPQDCIPCLKYAVDEISKLCPNEKNGAVLYKRCFLRYSNENFLGRPTGIEQFTNYTTEISKEREEFVKVRKKLFAELLVEATDGSGSPKYFAKGGKAVSSDLYVFGLLQCTWDLTKEDCHGCLKSLIAAIPAFGQYYVGLLLLQRSCFGMYENKLFYNGTMPPPLPPEYESKVEKVNVKMIGGCVAAGLFIVAIAFGLWIWRKNKNGKDWKSKKVSFGGDGNRHNNTDESFPLQDGRLRFRDVGIKTTSVKHLSLRFADLVTATNHFSKENMIGRGGFGYVYKGILNEQEIAVKRMSDNDSLQAAEQLDKEVTLLAGLQHINLVRLIGYCVEENEMLLVYEYMSNGSLETHLFDPNSGKDALNWTSKLLIIDGIIKGIKYLHEDSRLKIFHRDLKLENILLDQDMTPKITDFGISKFNDVNQTRGSVTTNIIGTGGYMAPEYRFYGQFTSKSDVYSLGVMLLEILTGIRLSRRNNTPQIPNLRSFLSAYWKDATLDEKLAKIECETYTKAQENTLKNILNIAMLCVDNDPDLRPKISYIRDFIKLANNSSFKMCHMSTAGTNVECEVKLDDSDLLPSLTLESTKPISMKIER